MHCYHGRISSLIVIPRAPPYCRQTSSIFPSIDGFFLKLPLARARSARLGFNRLEDELKHMDFVRVEGDK